MPLSLWQSLIGDSIAAAAACNEGEANTSTIFSSVNARFEIGRLSARCEECKTKLPELGAEQLTGTIDCPSCGKTTGARPAPDWFKELHPAITTLIGESLATDAATTMEESEPVVIRCISCAGALAVDGSARQINCSYCSAQNFLPDQIWLRLHPASTRTPWFLQLDLGDSVGLLPDDCDPFLGIGCGPGGQVILGYIDAEDICHIVGLDSRGLIAWDNDTITLDDYYEARIRSGPGGHALVLLDCAVDRAHFLDPTSGRLLSTISASSEPGGDPGPNEPRPLELDAYRDVAIDVDGSLVTVQHGRDESKPLLTRYAANGSWQPMWSSEPDRALRKRMLRDPWRQPHWNELANHLLVPPIGARMTIGQDGLLYLVDQKLRHLAAYNRDGILVQSRALVPPKLDRSFDDFGVDGAGNLYALGEMDGGGKSDWYHVVRILAGGNPEVIAGPALPESAPIGECDDRMYVTPAATLYIAYELDSIRLVDGYGRLLWRSHNTKRHDDDA